MAEEIVDQAQRNSSLFVEGLAERIRGQALAGIQPPRLDQAEKHFAHSLAKLEEGGARLEAARTRVAWSQVLAQGGNAQAAREQLEQAAAQFQVSGLVGELEQTKRLVDSLSTRPKSSA